MKYSTNYVTDKEGLNLSSSKQKQRMKSMLISVTTNG